MAKKNRFIKKYRNRNIPDNMKGHVNHMITMPFCYITKESFELMMNSEELDEKLTSTDIYIDRIDENNMLLDFKWIDNRHTKENLAIFPPDVRTLMEYVAGLGCGIIRFEADEFFEEPDVMYPQLTTYEWDKED